MHCFIAYHLGSSISKCWKGCLLLFLHRKAVQYILEVGSVVYSLTEVKKRWPSWKRSIYVSGIYLSDSEETWDILLKRQRE